ncbi:hypothetical protein XENOCAPTIV_029567 [Xenoophorus captivus]|uniref:RAB20, member RAS oncogene family n=1 Tax=Xenoophorus captivus TaxID=1517983 RepID=A0ABV0RBF6_9TELE
MKKPDVKLVILGDMNVGKTSLLHRYMERKTGTLATVGHMFSDDIYSCFQLKCDVQTWPFKRNLAHFLLMQFHGLGSMYCRGAAAIILTYDVTNWQSLAELEERFLSLTYTANHDCIYALVGNKADLTDPKAHLSQDLDGLSEDRTECKEERTEPQVLSAWPTPPASPTSLSGLLLHKQVARDDALALYGRILRYKGLDEKSSLPADKLCFETSAKTGYNVDILFETLFDLVLPSILRKRHENQASPTVDLEDCREVSGTRVKSSCC